MTERRYVQGQTVENPAPANRRPSNDLADWFPCVVASGVDVPRTMILRPGIDLLSLLDGEAPHGFDTFLEDLHQAALKVCGWCFRVWRGRVRRAVPA